MNQKEIENRVDDLCDDACALLRSKLLEGVGEEVFEIILTDEGKLYSLTTPSTVRGIDETIIYQTQGVIEPMDADDMEIDFLMDGERETIKENLEECFRRR